MSQHLRFSLPVLLLSLASCHGSVRVSGNTPPHPVPLYFESEPNDAVSDADFVSTLNGGRRLTVRGNLQAEYGDIDGFAFIASEPVTIDFALDEFDLFGDLAICLYDPLRDEYVACYSSFLEEKGTFDILQPGREFHLVVYSEHFDCGSGYDLDLLVTPLPYALEAGAGSNTAYPRPVGSEPLQAPARAAGYTADRHSDGPAAERPSRILGQALRLTLDPAGQVVDLSPGALVLRTAAP